MDPGTLITADVLTATAAGAITLDTTTNSVDLTTSAALATSTSMKRMPSRSQTLRRPMVP